MNSRAINRETQDGLDLPLILATSAAILTLLPVAASQLGWIAHLPDLSGSAFDSKRITDSKQAHPLGIPDGLLGIASYGSTLMLVWTARSRPAARKYLAAKLLADGVVAALNTARQVVSFRKLCSWCMGTVICTACMLIAGRGVITQSIKSLSQRTNRQRTTLGLP